MPLSGTESAMQCGKCGSEVRVLAFPALVCDAAPPPPAPPVVADESACFYHPAKQASEVCSGCGRFLCSLCEVDYRGRPLCTSCIESGRAEEPPFRSRYIHYDAVALAMVLLPIIPPLTYFSFIFAPAGIFLAIYYWREPMSILPRRRWRALVAIGLGAFLLISWVILLAMMIMAVMGISW